MRDYYVLSQVLPVEIHAGRPVVIEALQDHTYVPVLLIVEQTILPISRNLTNISVDANYKLSHQVTHVTIQIQN